MCLLKIPMKDCETSIWSLIYQYEATIISNKPNAWKVCTQNKSLIQTLHSSLGLNWVFFFKKIDKSIEFCQKVFQDTRRSSV